MKAVGFALAVAVAALAPVAAGSPAAAQRAKDWTATVTRAANGAYVMGNPKAKVKLVEYLSMTCSHCADFSAEAWGPLKANYIARGKVSLEVRHAVRDGFDFTASLLARCDGARSYFAASEALFAGQATWMERASAWASSGVAVREDGPLNMRLSAYARGAGLDSFFAARGFGPVRMASCLSSKPEQEALGAMADEAWKQRKIGGTPAFLINGELLPGVSTWAALEPKIAAAAR